MSVTERSIGLAYDRTNNTAIKAIDAFKNQKLGFELRNQYNDLICCNCGQKLKISITEYGKDGTMYFAHVGKEDCELKTITLTEAEKEEFAQIFKSKESPRHIELKNRIGANISTLDGVEKDSVIIDSKFVFYNNRRRKPDVYFKYRDYEFVIEIQVSNLSAKYIIERTKFYKEKGIYLLWILDDLSDENHNLLRNIKHLTKYQNLYKYNENSEGFGFICSYKVPSLNNENQYYDRTETSEVNWYQRIRPTKSVTPFD